MVERGVEIINFFFIGHYGNRYEMGGVTIGNTIIVLMLLSMFLGLGSSVCSFLS